MDACLDSLCESRRCRALRPVDVYPAEGTEDGLLSPIARPQSLRPGPCLPAGRWHSRRAWQYWQAGSPQGRHGRAGWERLRKTLPGSQKPGPGTWALAIGGAGWALRKTLPGQGPGLPAAPTFQVSKTWKRFSEARQQPGAKTRALATGQALWNLPYSTGQAGWERLRETLPGSQKPGRLGGSGKRCRARGQAFLPPQPSRFPKPGSARLLCRRPAGFSEARQQPGAKTRALATGQALWNLSYSTGQAGWERLRKTLPGSQKPGRLGAAQENTAGFLRTRPRDVGPRHRRGRLGGSGKHCQVLKNPAPGRGPLP